MEKKTSTTHKELQSLVGLFSFAVKVVYPGRAFLRRLYDTLAKGGKYLRKIYSSMEWSHIATLSPPMLFFVD